MNSNILDVHGAGAQRSNSKQTQTPSDASSLTNSYGTFSYKGPQGDSLRINNMVRCVRDDNSTKRRI